MRAKGFFGNVREQVDSARSKLAKNCQREVEIWEARLDDQLALISGHEQRP
jgi:hypothetical protein